LKWVRICTNIAPPLLSRDRGI